MTITARDERRAVVALAQVVTGMRLVKSDTPLPQHHHVRVYPSADAEVLK